MQMQINKKVNKEKLNQILNLIKESDKILLESIDKSIVIIGRTGSGKSTLVNYLVNINNLIVEVNENGDHVFALGNISNNIAKIGHTLTSETSLPNKIINFATNEVFWDCPGFGDTKGVLSDVLNAY